jgi:iron-sulfur cluster assembly protein
MIQITESASQKIKEMLAETDEASFLRVGVRPGGCSGFSYGITFDHEKSNEDIQIKQFDIDIVIDPISATYLKGVQIDYKQSMMGGGFTIENPNAVATCGCGTSFKSAIEEGKVEKCD